MMRTTASIQDAMRILAGEYDLPGPFTILQGMGDGMANTIDTMPQLVVGNQNHSEGEGIHDEGAGAGRDGNVDDNADQSSGTDSNGVDHEQLSFGSVPREISERDGSNASSSNTDRRSVSINGSVNENGNDNSNSRENSEADLFSYIGGSGSESSSVDVLSIGSHHDPIVANSAATASAATTRTKDARASDNRSTLNQGRRFSPRRGRTTRIGNGLHLPIPTGVAPIGYNSILPPVTTNLNLPPHPQSPQRSNDEYIMVDDRNITREIIPIDADDADANANSPADQCPELQYETPEPSSTNTRYNLLSTQNHQSIKEWDLISRENETMELGEVLLRSSSNPLTLLSGDQWWKSRRHRLFIFDEPPSFQPSQAVHISTDRKTRANRYSHAHDSERESDEWHLHYGQIRGELAPGSTVVGVEILSISHPRKRRPKNNQSSRAGAGVGVIEVLKIDSPREGYIVYSVDGYPFVGPGLPSTYTESDVWLWKVTCPNGAYVRQGLELTSAQVDTIPFGSFVQIKRKTINAMGLSRLKVEAFVRTESDADANAKHATGGGATRLDTALQSFSWRSQSSSKNHVQKKQSQQSKKIVGWISEVLNPLSGQNGPIVQPIPFPIPSQYRVTLPEGAVIREGVELSSNQIGHAPFGSLLSIVGQGFSQHPMERCIQRLKLAGGGGWVSVQLNSQSPEDQLSVLEQVGTDGSFEPDEPGFFHIEKQLKVIDEYHANVDDPDDSNLEHRTNVRRSLERLISSVSSINDEDDTAENSADISNNDSSMASSAIPTLFRSGVANHSGSQTTLKCGSKQLQDEPCLICLTEERNATIVHGETGHIACCLTCARLLKGRGDKCPVCRLPIDMIIQQFWA